MKKIILLLSIMSSLLSAEKVEVSADSFEADEKNQRTILSGHVLLKKGADIVHAQSLTILFDKKNKPTSYVASGKIKFQINTDTQKFKGHAQRLSYNPKTLKYEIAGDAFIHELTQDRKLYGDTIMIDRKSGKSTIKGGKNRPVKFIFEVIE